VSERNTLEQLYVYTSHIMCYCSVAMATHIKLGCIELMAGAIGIRVGVVHDLHHHHVR